jgi:hypothetical protein
MAAEVISLGEGALTRSRASEVVHQETQVETRDYEDHTFAGDRCSYTRSKEETLAGTPKYFLWGTKWQSSKRPDLVCPPAMRLRLPALLARVLSMVQTREIFALIRAPCTWICALLLALGPNTRPCRRRA